MTDPFDGDWKIDLDDPRSRVWDAVAGGYGDDPIDQELISLRTVGDVQHYEVRYGLRPMVRMGYTTRFDDPEWVGYEVREIANTEGLDLTGTFAGTLELGKPYCYVRTVRVDERSHYRVVRALDGNAQYVMLRRLEDDGDRYASTIMDMEGKVTLVRIFVRDA